MKRTIRLPLIGMGDRSESFPSVAGSPYRVWQLAAGAIALVLVAVLSASVGSVAIPPSKLLHILGEKLSLLLVAGDVPAEWRTIVWELRLPRVLLAGLVGAALALSGAAYQGLFRNPLAEPYLLGVASGAGLGAVLVLTTRIPLYVYGLNLVPIASFIGGLLAVGTAYAVARKVSGAPRATLILSGVAVAALAGALTSLLLIFSDPDVRPVLSWLLGGFGGAHWNQVKILLLYIVPCGLVIAAHGRILNVLQLNEEEAAQLGVNVARTKLLLIALSSLAAAVAVSVSGLIGFVGLIAPHAVRLIWGGDYRFLLPMSMVAGAAFLILADLVARTAVSPGELPVGIVTALCGAPFFLYLLKRGGRS